MYAREIKSEETYTLEQARQIILAENKKKKAKRIYKAKQKLLGLLAIALSILIPIFIGDATISFFLFPLGIITIFTKENVI